MGPTFQLRAKLDVQLQIPTDNCWAILVSIRSFLVTTWHGKSIEVRATPHSYTHSTYSALHYWTRDQHWLDAKFFSCDKNLVKLKLGEKKAFPSRYMTIFFFRGLTLYI
jgi:hypothetical protein